MTKLLLKWNTSYLYVCVLLGCETENYHFLLLLIGRNFYGRVQIPWGSENSHDFKNKIILSKQIYVILHFICVILK